MQDLYGAEPTQETCPTVVDHANHVDPTGQRELDHTDRESISPAKFT